MAENKIERSNKMIRAISEGKNLIKQKETKANVARHIYNIMNDESRKNVIIAFMEGAKLTKNGANTYYYNISHE